MELCHRPQCSRVARASVVVVPAELFARLEDLSEGGQLILCDEHADKLTVPLGWELHDGRRVHVDDGGVDENVTPLLARAFRTGR